MSANERVFVTAIFRNESRYLREWLEFYLIQEVERFYLYNNNSDDDYLSVLQPYIDKGIVDLTDWPMAKPCQLQAYQHNLDRLRGEAVWVAYVDLDEFLFSPRFDTIPEALAHIRSLHPFHPSVNSAIGVSWACFGSSGQSLSSPLPVIERFHWRLADSNPVNSHIKSLIRLDQDVRTGGDPHFFHAARGTMNELGDPIYGPFSPHSSSFLRVNHYVTKSREEWEQRTRLGTPDRVEVKVDEQDYLGYQMADVDDRGEDSIQRFLPELRRRLAL